MSSMSSARPCYQSAAIPRLVRNGPNVDRRGNFLSSRPRCHRKRKCHPHARPSMIPPHMTSRLEAVRQSDVQSPAHGVASLYTGTWFKLICGASTHDVPMVRNLCQVYTLAGVDCIDVAAEAAIIRAAREGIDRGIAFAAGSAVSRPIQRPLLMISVNDDCDIHFRKAYFNPNKCPVDCTRPCEAVCPADAINDTVGVVEARCYGCGRCIPACPLGLVDTHDRQYNVSEIRQLLHHGDVDALEIHTGKNRLQAFGKLWEELAVDISKGLQVVAVSFPDLGPDNALAIGLSYMWECMHDVVQQSNIELIWQVDGRPMSGDIGAGTAHAAVALAKRVREILTHCGIGGHIQLAGGTNWRTVDLMRNAGILRDGGQVAANQSVSGLAVGGYARKDALGADGQNGYAMEGQGLDEAVRAAVGLVSCIKGYSHDQDGE